MKGSKINRTIGEGTWHGEDAGLEIIHENHRIGMKKRLRYKKKQSKQHGGWIMHDYSLDYLCWVWINMIISLFAV